MYLFGYMSSAFCSFYTVFYKLISSLLSWDMKFLILFLLLLPRIFSSIYYPSTSWSINYYSLYMCLSYYLGGHTSYP